MDKNILIQFINDGFSTYQIAKETGKGQTAIRYWLKKYGLKTNHLCKKGGTPHSSLTRTCKSCQQNFPNTEEFFYKNGGRLHVYCKKCANQTVVERQRNIKKELIAHKGGKCHVCGYDKYFGALEFHHLDPNAKEFTLSNKLAAVETMKKEADKCVLLCANCHREVHGGIITLDLSD